MDESKTKYLSFNTPHSDNKNKKKKEKGVTDIWLVVLLKLLLGLIYGTFHLIV